MFAIINLFTFWADLDFMLLLAKNASAVRVRDVKFGRSDGEAVPERLFGAAVIMLCLRWEMV